MIWCGPPKRLLQVPLNGKRVASANLTPSTKNETFVRVPTIHLYKMFTVKGALLIIVLPSVGATMVIPWLSDSTFTTAEVTTWLKLSVTTA